MQTHHFSRAGRAAVLTIVLVLTATAAAAQGSQQAQIGGDGELLGGNTALRIGVLGISAQMLAGADATARGLAPGSEGAIVARVGRATAGARAGLRAGDIIVAVNGERLGPGRDLRAVMADLTPAVEFELRVIRGGEEQTVDVSLVSPAG